MSKKQKSQNSSTAKHQGKNPNIRRQQQHFLNKKNSSIISVLVITVALGAYLLFFKNSSEPKFVKQGDVTFMMKGTKSVIKKIEVEVAADPTKRAQGLMYRSKMDESNGMLFIFENSDFRRFWMKNTLIPLDIAFIDSSGVIDTIYRKTQPLSETALPSRRKVQFVIETNGGFSDNNKIKEGDLISFNVDQK